MKKLMVLMFAVSGLFTSSACNLEPDGDDYAEVGQDLTSEELSTLRAETIEVLDKAWAEADDDTSTTGLIPDCTVDTNSVTCTKCKASQQVGGHHKSGFCITSVCSVHDTSGEVVCSSIRKPR